MGNLDVLFLIQLVMIYELVDGKCVMVSKFIKETNKYEKCEPLE
jgi:hypothetical protein